MTTREDIFNKIHEFVSTTGKNATCLYLGRDQYDSLRVQAEPWMHYGYCGERTRFEGLDLFLVDVKDHLNVA